MKKAVIVLAVILVINTNRWSWLYSMGQCTK